MRGILQRWGHKVISSFYNYSDNYTSYTSERTHYVKIALGIKDIFIPEGDPREHDHDHGSSYPESAISTQYKEPFDDAIVYLQSMFDNINPTGLQINEGMTADEIIGQILDLLNQISNSINLDAQKASIYLEVSNNDECEEENDEIILDTQESPVCIEITNGECKEEIRPDAIKLARKTIDKIEEILEILQVRFNTIINDNELNSINLLEALKGIFEPLNIEGISEEIDRKKSLLEGLSEIDFNLLRPMIAEMIAEKIGWFGKQFFDPSGINLNQLRDDFVNNPSQVKEEVNEVLNNLLSEKPNIIRDIVISSLESSISAENIYDSIHKEATTYAKCLIFKNKNTLPGIEFSHVQMIRKGNDITFSLDPNIEDSRITDGMTLGTAMSALAERLKQFETFEEDLYDAYNNHQLLFSLFNKSLSMVGHYIKDDLEGTIYEEVLPTSFFRPLVRKKNQGRYESINIYNYYDLKDDKTQPGYFAIPDKIILKEDQAFTVDLEKTQEGDMRSSVLSQAELVRGASKILKYLRPDRSNSYDEDGGMGQLNILDNILFPKLSLFNLHFGIAGVSLTNLKKAGTYIYRIERSPIFCSNCDTEGALMASVHDVFEADSFINATLDDVRTTDIARLMIAIEEFIPIFEDLDNNQIENISDIDRESYKLVTDNLDTLETLNLGLHFFITRRLQKEDGCFFNSYNIESQAVDDTIFLDTQVQAMLALTDFYRKSREVVEGDGPQGLALQGSILRAFNCLTERLFDRQNGFYVVQEGTNQRPHLRLTTDLLRLLYKLDIVFANRINERQELDQLRAQWTQSYISQLEPLENGLEVEIIDSIQTQQRGGLYEEAPQVSVNPVTGLDNIDTSTLAKIADSSMTTYEDVFLVLFSNQINLNFDTEKFLETVELLNSDRDGHRLLNELNTELQALIDYAVAINNIHNLRGRSKLIAQRREARAKAEAEEKIRDIMELATTCLEEPSAQAECLNSRRLYPHQDNTYYKNSKC